MSTSALENSKNKSLDFHALAGLSFDRGKNRYQLRLTIHRGRKVVGKRLAVRVKTTDEQVAMLVRDGVLSFASQLGLTIVQGKQRRRRDAGEKEA